MLLAQSDGQLAKAARVHVARLLPQQPRGGGRALAREARYMLRVKQICIPVFLGLSITAGPRVRTAETESRIPVVEIGRVLGAGWLDVLKSRC